MNHYLFSRRRKKIVRGFPGLELEQFVFRADDDFRAATEEAVRFTNVRITMRRSLMNEPLGHRYSVVLVNDVRNQL